MKFGKANVLKTKGRGSQEVEDRLIFLWGDEEVDDDVGRGWNGAFNINEDVKINLNGLNV